MSDHEDLAQRIEQGGSIDPEERSFIAKLIRGAAPMKTREIIRLRRAVAAEHVVILRVIAQIPRKVAIEAACRRYGIERSTVERGLEENKDDCSFVEGILSDRTKNLAAAKPARFGASHKARARGPGRAAQLAPWAPRLRAALRSESEIVKPNSDN